MPARVIDLLEFRRRRECDGAGVYLHDGKIEIRPGNEYDFVIRFTPELARQYAWAMLEMAVAAERWK